MFTLCDLSEIKFCIVLYCIGYIPGKWDEGCIVPLHTKVDVNGSGNYRGIILLSTFGKLFTKVINNRLTNWAENYNVYIEVQAGFRKKMSTVDNMCVLHGLMNHLLNNNIKLYTVIVDNTKGLRFLLLAI